MTHISKITKAELNAENAELQEKLAEAQVQVQLALSKVIVPQRVPEADALGGCVRALDALPGLQRSTSYSSTNKEPDRSTIRRVLVSLANRYDITLIERTTEPCSRTHLDEVPDVSLKDAMGWVTR